MNNLLEKFLTKPFKEQLFWIIFIILVVIFQIDYRYYSNVFVKKLGRINTVREKNHELEKELHNLNSTLDNLFKAGSVIENKEQQKMLLQQNIIDRQRKNAQKNRKLETEATNYQLLKILTMLADKNIKLKNLDVLPSSRLNNIERKTFSLLLNMTYRETAEYFKQLEQSKFWLIPEEIIISKSKDEADRDNLVDLKLNVSSYRIIKEKSKLVNDVLTSLTDNKHIIFYSREMFKKPVSEIIDQSDTTEQKIVTSENSNTSLPEFNVKGILDFGTENKGVIIDNSIIKAGEKIQGWMVVDINSSRIKFSKNGTFCNYDLKKMFKNKTRDNRKRLQNTKK